MEITGLEREDFLQRIIMELKTNARDPHFCYPSILLKKAGYDKESGW